MSVSAREIIDAMNAIENTDRDVVAENLHRIFDVCYPKKHTRWSKRVAIISKATNSSKNTVHAWVTDGRKARVPPMKLLMIADVLDIPYEYLLCENGAWLDEATRDKIEQRIKELEKEV